MKQLYFDLLCYYYYLNCTLPTFMCLSMKHPVYAWQFPATGIFLNFLAGHRLKAFSFCSTSNSKMIKRLEFKYDLRFALLHKSHATRTSAK